MRLLFAGKLPKSQGPHTLDYHNATINGDDTLIASLCFYLYNWDVVWQGEVTHGDPHREV